MCIRDREKQPEITIVYNADSSGILQNQIEEGYECDLFFSADVKQMEILEQEGFVQEGTRRDPVSYTHLSILWYQEGIAEVGF